MQNVSAFTAPKSIANKRQLMPWGKCSPFVFADEPTKVQNMASKSKKVRTEVGPVSSGMIKSVVPAPGGRTNLR